MPKLNQILAIDKGEKVKSNRAFTDLHNKAQKPALYDGRVRSYEASDDGGEGLPDERQLVQMRAKAVLESAASILQPYWDIVATKDWANASGARSDVVVGDTVIVENAPVSWLLFMEKQIADLETFVQKMPTLDAAQVWKWDASQGCYVTDQTWQNRTKKMLRNHEKSAATAHHPAQVEVYTEDAVIGRFKTILHSGAIPVDDKESLLERVRVFRKALLFAREQANSVAVETRRVAEAVFGFILEPIRG